MPSHFPPLLMSCLVFSLHCIARLRIYFALMTMKNIHMANCSSAQIGDLLPLIPSDATRSTHVLTQKLLLLQVCATPSLWPPCPLLPRPR
jgi:hypothetical protein